MANFYRMIIAFGALMLSSVASHATESAPMDVDGSKRITIERGMELWEEGVVFLDVRPMSNYDEGRIPGAVSLHVDSALTEESVSEVVNTDDPVVIYCNGVKCGLSAKAIPMLVAWGYTNIFYLRDGYPGWENAGFPVE